MSEQLCVRLAAEAMRCRFELLLVGDDEAWLRSVGEAAIDEIESAHASLTRFERGSTVSRINSGGLQRVDVDVFALLELAERVRGASGGAFDIRRRGTGEVRMDPASRSVEVLRGAQLDLGGIAKGYAIDRTVAVLREEGVESAFVHGGSSSAAGIGVAPDGWPWRVRLFGGTGPMISLSDRALGVSGDDHQPGHIMDPRTAGRREVTMSAACVGMSAAECDGWSTAIAVLGEVPEHMPGDVEVHVQSSCDEREAPPSGPVRFVRGDYERESVLIRQSSGDVAAGGYVRVTH